MEGKTILVVDDEPDILDSIKTGLESAGANVLTAVDGAAGYQTATKEHPDLILMDIYMPDMDGHEAVKKLRSDVWGSTAKVIYLTAYSDADNVVAAVKNESAEYIVKSHTSLEDIIKKCKEVLAST